MLQGENAGNAWDACLGSGTQRSLRILGRECPCVMLILGLRFALQIKTITNAFEFYAIN